MKTQKNMMALALVAGLWLLLVLGCSSVKKAMDEKRAEREGPGVSVSAEDLNRAYQTNEADADKLYQGKIVIVTGTVGTVSAPGEGMGRPAVILVDPQQKEIVNCFGFPAEARDAIKKLKPGQKVTVKGKCMGKIASDIPSLEDSVLQ